MGVSYNHDLECQEKFNLLFLILLWKSNLYDSKNKQCNLLFHKNLRRYVCIYCYTYSPSFACAKVPSTVYGVWRNKKHHQEEPDGVLEG